MINWQDKDPHKIERAIQALLRRRYNAQAIDGSGGDGGQDAVLTTASDYTIFEIKSFTRTLTPSQKRQIRRSLQNALSHSPERWVLIMPKNPSPSERTWFNGYLRQDLGPDLANTTLEWWGKDWFDEMFAANEDLRRYVEGTDYALLERSSELSMEQAALKNGINDLLARHRGLAVRANELSPYWGLTIKSSGSGQEVTLEEKFPGARSEDPITFQPTFAFDLSDKHSSELYDRVREAIEYGGDVTIPGDFIPAFKIDASPETRALLGIGNEVSVEQLVLQSHEDPAGLPLVSKLVLRSPEAETRHTLQVIFARRVWGTSGCTLEGKDVSGILSVKLFLRVAKGSTVASSVNLDLAAAQGRYAHAILPAVKLLGTLQDGDSIEFQNGPATAGRTGRLARSSSDYEESRELLSLVDALDEIGRHIGEPILVPVELSNQEIQEAIAAAKVLRGERARLPYSGVSLNIVPGRVGEFLTALSEDNGTLYATYEEMFFELSGQSIPLGRMSIYAPEVRLVNREHLAGNVDSTNPVARFATRDGDGIYWMPPIE